MITIESIMTDEIHKLRNQITVNFLYEEPTVALVDDGDV